MKKLNEVARMQELAGIEENTFETFKEKLALDIIENGDPDSAEETADEIRKSTTIKDVAKAVQEYVMADDNFEETWKYILDEFGGMEFHKPYAELVDVSDYIDDEDEDEEYDD